MKETNVTTSEAVRPVLEFDHHSPLASHDRPAVLEMVSDHSVFWTEAHGGYWVVCTHALCKEVLRDPDTFSSAKLPDGTRGVTVPSIGPVLLPAEVDAPRHTVLRKLLWDKFNRKAVAELRPLVQSIVTGAVDTAIAKG